MADSVDHGGQLTFRPALESDIDRLLEWRNDPRINRWFGNSDPVEPAHHRSWIEARASNQAPTLWVAERSTQLVGVVRLDVQPIELQAEVSITVAPEAWGSGVGRSLLAHVHAVGTAIGVRQLLARIHVENLASKALFLSAGYRESGLHAGAFVEYLLDLK